MDPEVRQVALSYAAEHYPLADLVVVGGSAAHARRERSDIDLLIIGPDAMFTGEADEAAHTDRWNGELFEVFAATPEAFGRHLDNGIERRRPVSAFLLLDGVAVVDRRVCDTLFEQTSSLITRGPTLSPDELDQRRYGVTTTLDDLLDADEPVESAVLAGLLFQRLAEFLLLADGGWMAAGRSLLLRLRQCDPDFADAFGAALVARDPKLLETLTLEALAPYGGRLMEGHHRSTQPRSPRVAQEAEMSGHAP